MIWYRHLTKVSWEPKKEDDSPFHGFFIKKVPNLDDIAFSIMEGPYDEDPLLMHRLRIKQYLKDRFHLNDEKISELIQQALTNGYSQEF